MDYNTTPLPRIINSRDPITGCKLVLFHNSKKRKNGYRPNPKIPVCRSDEEHLVENYDLAKNEDFKGWVCHHRLELTIDGKFANSAMDLVNKDMYFHRPYYELIWMKNEDHASLHRSGDKNPMHGKGELVSGDKNPMYGRTGDKNPMYGRTLDKNPMYGITEDKHPKWKGDDATEHSKRMRERRAKKRALRDCALLHRSNLN